MKKLLLLMSISLLFLGACGDNDEVEAPSDNNADGQDVAVEEDLANEADEAPLDVEAPTEHPYPLIDFDLDVDMGDDQDIIEADYEYEPNEVEASYYDRNKDIQLSGNEAMEELDKIFSTFDFNETSSKEEVLDAIRSGFEIPEDAKRIEVDITYLDQTEVEFVEGQ